ncbi:MAG: adaptor protein MecA [Eubacterium sp.]|nr:adaptor protein MecA [Eubacterium sp.]
MRIERISDNQIKCTLSKHDLLERHIKISELAYGSERAKELFRDMMEQANIDFGFDAEDIPLMIEAIPTSRDSLVLMITKVDNPQEFDERFPNFNIEDDEYEEDYDDYDNDSDVVDQESNLTEELTSCFEQLQDIIENYTENTNGSEEDDKFIPLSEALANGKTSKKSQKNKNNDGIHERTKLYSFVSIKPIIEAAHKVTASYTGKNTIWKDAKSNKYYLLMNRGNGKHAFNSACSTISEFGLEEPFTYATQDYFNEHFVVIIKDKALSQLARL